MILRPTSIIPSLSRGLISRQRRAIARFLADESGQILLGGSADCVNCDCNPTITPTGGCCRPDGSCAILTAAACATAGGTYKGDDTVCSPNPCPQPPCSACEGDQDSATVVASGLPPGCGDPSGIYDFVSFYVPTCQWVFMKGGNQLVLTFCSAGSYFCGILLAGGGSFGLTSTNCACWPGQGYARVNSVYCGSDGLLHGTFTLAGYEGCTGAIVTVEM